MRARPISSQNPLDFIARSFGLTEKQVDTLKAKMREWVQIEAQKAAREIMTKYEQEEFCLGMLVLHHGFGFGRKRLRRYHRQFFEQWQEIVEAFQGAEPNCTIAYHKIKQLYLDFDEWGD